MLARVQRTSPENTWIGVTDAQGIVRAAIGNLMIGSSAQGRTWFNAGSVALHVGDVHPVTELAPFFPPTTDGKMLCCVDFETPIVSAGKTVGVVISHGSRAWVYRAITRLAPPNAAEQQFETFVFDRDGKMLYEPGKTLAMHRAAGQNRFQPQPAARMMRWNDGREYVTAVERLPANTSTTDLGWTIVSRQPVEIAFPMRESRWRTLRRGVATTLAAMVLVWFLAGRISRSLTEIATAARNVGSRVPGSASRFCAAAPRCRSSRSHWRK